MYHPFYHRRQEAQPFFLETFDMLVQEIFDDLDQIHLCIERPRLIQEPFDWRDIRYDSDYESEYSDDEDEDEDMDDFEVTEISYQNSPGIHGNVEYVVFERAFPDFPFVEFF
eukprot:TRINITY_DN3898_c0_g1_i1.p1 TRINITY_DN3898_c0_g1~~TRINITY_DN3898_c0_g1_i1.p1  ORF type:complete len:120 (+),score=32.22 TRINITY_DN3898_c0_g1_i1:26-361(+)